MKKTIAHILVVLMVFYSIGEVSIVKAAEDFNVVPNDSILINSQETGSNYRQIEYIHGIGQYSFEYFIEDSNNEAWKVWLEFNNEKDSLTDVKVSAQKSNKESNSVFRVRKYEANKWGDNNTYNELPTTDQDRERMGSVAYEEGITKFNKVLDSNRKQNSLGMNDTQMYLELSNITVLSGDEEKTENLVIKVKKDGEKISFSTNGINKGLVTRFTLNSSSKKIEKYIFTGIDGLSIEPQHFIIDENNKIQSVEVLPIENEAEEKLEKELEKDVIEERNNPGKRAGLLISYQPIKRIKENGTFAFEKDEDYSTELRLESATEIKLNYRGDGSKVEYEITGLDKKGAVTKALESVNNKVTIKLASPQVISDLEKEAQAQAKVKGQKEAQEEVLNNIRESLIPWEGLTTSELIKDVEFATQLKGVEGRPIDTGEKLAKYTYLEYELGQTVDNKVHINLTPYKTKDAVDYYIFVDEKENLMHTNRLGFDKKDTNALSTYQLKIKGNDNGDKIKISIATKNKKYIRIVAVIQETKYCYSQIMKIDKDILDQEPETPTDLKVSNIVVTPSKNNPNDTIPSSVKVDLKWSAPSNLVSAYLNKRELYYEVILRETQDNKDEPGTSSKAAYSKIYKVSDDGKNLMLVGTNEIVGSNQNGVFTVKEAYLKRESSEKNWEQFVIEDQDQMKKHWDNPDSEFYQQVKEVSTLEDKETGKVYYLSLRAVYKEGNRLVDSAESERVPLPIDFTKIAIPVVNRLNYKKEAETFNEARNVTGEVGFDLIDISAYYHQMLEPSGVKLSDEEGKKYKGKYEFYLYKKDTNFDLKNVQDITQSLNKEQSKVDLKNYTQDLEKGSIVSWEYKIDNLIKDEDKAVSGNVFDKVLKLDDLRPNQAYMIKVRIKLEPIDKENSEKEITPHFSEFSKEFSFTTTTQANPPAIDERKPPTPHNIQIEEIEGSSTAVKVIWDQANFVKDDDMEVYYEIIRSTVDIRKDSTISLDTKLGDIIDQHNQKGQQDQVIGFATADVDDIKQLLEGKQKWMSYKGGNEGDRWQQSLLPNEMADVAYDKIYAKNELKKYSFEDSPLKVNKVYYYYVRTVAIIKNENASGMALSYNQVQSDWISANITTGTITAPRNLKVERENDKQDSAHSIILSFEAEVPFEASIPTEYDFKIFIKADEDKDYKEVNKSDLQGPKKQKTSSAEWTQYTYTIKNLESNTRYSIKVKLVDSIAEVESGYSEAIVTRTDYNEKDETDNENRKEYLNKWQAAMDKIKSRSYWKLDQEGTHKYRTEYIKENLAHQNIYTLIAEEEESYIQYYLPAEMIQYANENHTLLQFELGELKISVRANTLLDNQADIKEALKQIQAHRIQDYYVVIKSSQREVNEKINGENTLSPSLQFEMSLEYMNQKDKWIEESIVSALDNITEIEKNRFINLVEVELGRKIQDLEYLDELIEKSKDRVEDALSKEANRIVNRNYKDIKAIGEVNQTILISYPVNGASTNAYYYQNSWVKVPSLSNGKDALLEIKNWGWYVLTGMKNLIETVPTLAPYQTFMNQYDLAEIFKVDAYTIQTATTKQQMYSALAKVLGATDQTDHYVYLKSKGIKGLNKANLSSSIRQDEAIYLVMQGYEQLHHRSVQSIYNSNKQSVQNIGAFQNVYRDYIYSAVTLKIAVLQNNKIYPSSQITIETAIKMLYGIQN